jgi:hypothetical protein
MHAGNVKFRALIQRYKPVYRDTPKKLKPSVSTKVVAIWRAQEPPGRFLTRSDRFNGSKRTFYDVGDAMARRKAAQCLREKSSLERMEMQSKGGKRTREEEEEEEEEEDDEEEEATWLPTTNSFFLMQEQRDATTKTNETEEAITFPDLADELTSTKLFSSQFLSIISAPTHNSTTPTMNITSLLGTKNTMDSLRLKKNMVTIPHKNMGLDCGANLSFKVPATCNKKDDMSWFGAHKQDKACLSLMDIYAAESDDSIGDLQHRDATDSPFLFASFDLGNTAVSDDGDDDNGLCFPSLFGGNTAAKSDTTLTSMFGDDEEYDYVSPMFASLAPQVPNRRDDALQTIRDAMPTAAMLTSGLFDF